MDKLIDKLVDTRWFMKIVALILALFLFDSVYDADKELKNINVPGQQDSDIIEDVPVKSYYDTENLVVTGIPDTVDLSIEGPKSHLEPAKKQQNFEVYVDLTNAEIGSQRVEIKIRDISDKLDVTINPQYADVTVHEKVTQEFKVDAEFNNGLLGEGYTAEAASAEPKTVKITGAKEVIERISFVKATLDVKGPITETITDEATVRVLDREMNKLDVIVEPQVIQVTVPVKQLSKTVPVTIVRKGDPQDGVTINSIELDVNEASITGREEILNETESVRVEVDVSKIDKDTVLTLPVIIPDGISAVDPKTVKASVNVSTEENVNEEDNTEEPAEETEAQEQEETKTFSSLPINLAGLAEEYEAVLNNPASGRTSITVTGKSSTVQDLKAEDFNLYLSLADLGEGDHEVPINIDGPSGVEIKPAAGKATITITRKEEA
ncbi:CdaR family protein [Cytobacillus oceanisediminis]|uniref:CdaR family protein n=1 Tax=Cytobacillus oceanisediminis TaxID=665099 RepID=UPI001FB37018|nr:CdaR family protein [Cytobacillus oceanisediminis]UOE55673.1 YbbR-like domain-containing protein [Cytobacillus oceanisediminis]